MHVIVTLFLTFTAFLNTHSFCQGNYICHFAFQKAALVSGINVHTQNVHRTAQTMKRLTLWTLWFVKESKKKKKNQKGQKEHT